MELKNIFKMEMFKNRNDKPYLILVAILTVMATVSSILCILMYNELPEFTAILFIVFTVIGLFVFWLLYPFHLLNVDYKNKVISLLFASGVSRGKYYFVKISATILSSLIATFIILFIPIIIFWVQYEAVFIEVILRGYINLIGFNTSDVILVFLSGTVSLVANIVMLTTAVIITKGKTTGIFLYFAFLFIASAVQTNLVTLLQPESFSLILSLDILFSIIKIVIFALIGLQVLKKQDL